MDNPLKFTANGHSSFAQEWAAHRNMTDLWFWQGLLYTQDDADAYAFRIAIGALEVGLGQMASVSYVVEDLQTAVRYTCSWLLNKHSQPALSALQVDADSILFGETVQMLLDGGALALRMRGSTVGLDLCGEQTQEEFWYGRDGLLRFHQKQANRGRMFNVILPQMTVSGRLYLAGEERKVHGCAQFDRLWGQMHPERCRSHWERFQLFFDNGDQLLLTDFPHSVYHAGAWLNNPGGAKLLGEYSLQTTDFQQLDKWKLGAGWKLHIPEYSSEMWTLTPLNKEEYQLPLASPLLGIFDAQGNRVGYCFTSLMPGARNKRRSFNFKRFVTSKK